MKNSVEHYISELLFIHDCVVLPEFGGFVGNKKSAILNTVTGGLTPPTKEIVFNKNLTTNDGLLVSYIANHEKILNKEASDIVFNYSNELNNKLKGSKVLRIEKIGLFTVGQEGNIIFMQDQKINYSLDNFGMTRIDKTPIVRKTEIEETFETTFKRIKIESRSPKTMLRVAAVIFPLVALSYLSISQQDKITTIYTQMANLYPFTSVETKKSEKDTHILEIDVINNTTEDIIIGIPNTKAIEENIKQNNFHVIAGAFSKEKNARKLMERLKRWGYNPEILTEKELWRVTYESFNKREDAIIALNKIRKENQSAWLLTK